MGAAPRPGFGRRLLHVDTSTRVYDYLFLSDGIDRSFTIHCLLDMIEATIENDASNSPEPTNLD